MWQIFFMWRTFIRNSKRAHDDSVSNKNSLLSEETCETICIWNSGQNKFEQFNKRLRAVTTSTDGEEERQTSVFETWALYFLQDRCQHETLLYKNWWDSRGLTDWWTRPFYLWIDSVISTAFSLFNLNTDINCGKHERSSREKCVFWLFFLSCLLFQTSYLFSGVTLF